MHEGLGILEFFKKDFILFSLEKQNDKDKDTLKETEKERKIFHPLFIPQDGCNS